MSEEIIRVFDRSGRETAEIVARARRSWILDDEGECVFTLSTRDSKAREEILQYGNLVLVEHAQLPDWAGVIDLYPAERVWNGRSLTITAYSLERLLKSGTTPIRAITGTPGAIVKQIVDFYNTETDLFILPGEIWLGGNQREETLGDSCFVQTQRVMQRAHANWNISHRLEGGKLKLFINVYEKKGVQTGRLLFDGADGNIEKANPALTEAGPIYNIITGYSDASTSGTRLSITLRNEASIKLFGPRRLSQTFSGVTDMATLQKNTQTALNASSMPYKQTTIAILNKGNIYQSVDTGNIFDIHRSNVGFTNGALSFDAQVRLFSMEYEGTPDKVKAGVTLW